MDTKHLRFYTTILLVVLSMSLKAQVRPIFVHANQLLNEQKYEEGDSALAEIQPMVIELQNDTISAEYCLLRGVSQYFLGYTRSSMAFLNICLNVRISKALYDFDYINAQYFLGKCYESLNLPDSAEICYRHAVVHGSQYIDKCSTTQYIYSALADIYKAKGDTLLQEEFTHEIRAVQQGVPGYSDEYKKSDEESLKSLMSVLKDDIRSFGENHTETLRDYVLIAYVYNNLNKFQESIDILEKVIRRSIENNLEYKDSLSSVYTDLFYSYAMLGRNDIINSKISDVETYYQTHTNNKDSYGLFLYIVSNKLMDAGKYEEALIFLTKLKTYSEKEETVSGIFNAYDLLAEDYSLLNKYDEAVTLLESLCSLDLSEMSFIILKYKQSQYLCAEDKFKDAASILEKYKDIEIATCSEASQSNLLWCNQLAFCYTSTNEYKKAESLLRGLLKIVPSIKDDVRKEEADIEHNLGYALMEQSKYKEALEHLERSKDIQIKLKNSSYKSTNNYIEKCKAAL